MKRIWVLTLAIVLALILPLQANAAATSQNLLRVSWNHEPLTVYISLQNGVAPSYRNEVMTAFNDWSQVLKVSSGNSNAFNFTFLTEKPSKKNPADITVVIRKNTGAVLGTAFVKSSNGIIQSVKITLAANNAMGLPLGASDIRTIARHEIGHAIGLGHSNDDGKAPLDLMATTFDFMGVNYDIYPSQLNIGATLYIYGTDGFGTPNTSPIAPSYP